MIVGVLSILLGNVLDLADRGQTATIPTAEQRAEVVLNLVPHGPCRRRTVRRGPTLIAVEVAGVLLLAALVGAAAIVAHGKEKTRGEPRKTLKTRKGFASGPLTTYY